MGFGQLVLLIWQRAKFQKNRYGRCCHRSWLWIRRKNLPKGCRKRQTHLRRHNRLRGFRCRHRRHWPHHLDFAANKDSWIAQKISSQPLPKFSSFTLLSMRLFRPSLNWDEYFLHHFHRMPRHLFLRCTHLFDLCLLQPHHHPLGQLYTLPKHCF